MKIVKIEHDLQNNIINYALDNGDIIDRKKAVKMIERGEIDGAYLGLDENGTKTVMATMGANRVDDIRNLPEIL